MSDDAKRTPSSLGLVLDSGFGTPFFGFSLLASTGEYIYTMGQGAGREYAFAVKIVRGSGMTSS